MGRTGIEWGEDLFGQFIHFFSVAPMITRSKFQWHAFLRCSEKALSVEQVHIQFINQKQIFTTSSSMERLPDTSCGQLQTRHIKSIKTKEMEKKIYVI
jgi:hypothetical protein